MKGYVHHQVVGKNTLNTDGSVLRQAIYDPDRLPDGITQELLYQQGYQLVACTIDGMKKEFLLNVLSRKFFVIEGVPFYSSSGTSEDYAVISPVWRREVWMPCMGYEVQGKKPGRIAKLGDKASGSFKAFVTKLVQDWAVTVSDDALRLLWKPNNRTMFSRRETLDDLIVQMSRFGAIEAFSLSMQLLADHIWYVQESSGEQFIALRSLRDYYLAQYQGTYSQLSEQVLSEARQASFEAIHESYHVVELDGANGLRLVNRAAIKDEVKRAQIQREYQQEAYEINQKLSTLSPDITRIARLNNPENLVPNTFAAQLGTLIDDLKQSYPAEAAHIAWNQGIDQLIDNLLPLEQPLDVAQKKQQYKQLVESVFQTILALQQNQCPINEMPRFIEARLRAESIAEEEVALVREAIVYAMYQAYVSQLKQLTTECMRHIASKNPAYRVLTELEECLNNTQYSPKEQATHFFQHLLVNNSANLNVLKKDTSKDLKRWMIGVALISAILFTGIIPGLVIASIVYAKTGASVLDFFKPHNKGNQFSEEIESIKNRLDL